MKRLIGALVVGGATAIISAQADVRPQSTASQAAASTEWPTYGHDPGGMRFSPLTQITPANVSQLQVAWVYHMRPAAPAAGDAAAAARPRAARDRDADADAAARASRPARPRRSSSTA